MDNLEKNTESLEGEGWTVPHCLLEWVQLFGPVRLDDDLVKFLRLEAGLRKEKLGKTQSTLVCLLNHAIRHQMPIHKLSPRLATFQQDQLYARNSLIALFVIHGVVATETNEVSPVDWPNSSAFDDLLSEMHEPGVGPTFSFAYQFLNHLDIQGQQLTFSNLFEANFHRSNLSKCRLQEVVLQGANLKEADLERADLEKANLREANLREADLKDADLTGANLRETDLRGADLRGADLRRANLTEANLIDANLIDANLTGADLVEADLERE